MKKETAKARKRTRLINEKKRKKPVKKKQTKTITSPAMILDDYVGGGDTNEATIT